MEDSSKYWAEREKAYKAAETLARSGTYITNRNNPLVNIMDKPDEVFSFNMSMLEKDIDYREDAVHGEVYSSMMDHMRYGGNE